MRLGFGLTLIKNIKSLSNDLWILITGYWNDSGYWDDDSTWNDGE